MCVTDVGCRATERRGGVPWLGKRAHEVSRPSLWLQDYRTQTYCALETLVRQSCEVFVGAPVHDTAAVLAFEVYVFRLVHMLHKPGLCYCCTCLPGIVAPFAAVAGSRLLARPLSLFLSKLVRVGKRALGARKSYGCCVDGRLLYDCYCRDWAGFSGRCPADDVVLVPLLRLLQGFILILFVVVYLFGLSATFCTGSVDYLALLSFLWAVGALHASPES